MAPLCLTLKNSPVSGVLQLLLRDQRPLLYLIWNVLTLNVWHVPELGILILYGLKITPQNTNVQYPGFQLLSNNTWVDFISNPVLALVSKYRVFRPKLSNFLPVKCMKLTIKRNHHYQKSWISMCMVIYQIARVCKSPAEWILTVDIHVMISWLKSYCYG